MKYIIYIVIILYNLFPDLYGGGFIRKCPGKKEFFNITIEGDSVVEENDSILFSDLKSPKVNYTKKGIFGDELELIANSDNDTIYYLSGRGNYCKPDNHITPHFNYDYTVYTEPLKIKRRRTIYFYAQNGTQKSVETHCLINKKLRFKRVSGWDNIAGTRNINSYTMYSPESKKVLTELQYNTYNFVLNYSIAVNSDPDISIYGGLGIGIHLQVQVGFSYNKNLSFRTTYTKLLEIQDTGLDLPFGLHWNILYEYNSHYRHMVGAGIGITFQADLRPYH